jgi:hypothetical protein
VKNACTWGASSRRGFEARTASVRMTIRNLAHAHGRPRSPGGPRQPGVPAAPSWMRGWGWIGSVEQTSRAAARPHGPAAVAALTGDRDTSMMIHVRGALRERGACFPHRTSSALAMQENCALATVRRRAGMFRAGRRARESGRPPPCVCCAGCYTIAIRYSCPGRSRPRCSSLILAETGVVTPDDR